MLQSITITSKRQLSIPSGMFNALNLATGDRLIVEIQDNKLIMQKAQNLLDEIAGSLSPSPQTKLTSDQIITQAKIKRFSTQK